MNRTKLSLLLALGLFIINPIFAQQKLRKATKNDLDGKCKACVDIIKSIPIDVKWGVTVENGVIIFKITNPTYLDKIFSSVDGIVIDIVSRDQYACGKINKEAFLNNVRRGTLSDPAFYSNFKDTYQIDTYQISLFTASTYIFI